MLESYGCLDVVVVDVVVVVVVVVVVALSFSCLSPISQGSGSRASQ